MFKIITLYFLILISPYTVIADQKRDNQVSQVIEDYFQAVKTKNVEKMISFFPPQIIKIHGGEKDFRNLLKTFRFIQFLKLSFSNLKEIKVNKKHFYVADTEIIELKQDGDLTKSVRNLIGIPNGHGGWYLLFYDTKVVLDFLAHEVPNALQKFKPKEPQYFKYINGKWIKKLTRAQSEISCIKNNSDGCFQLGIYEWELKRDKNARKFFLKSCLLQNSQGCFFLGLFEDQKRNESMAINFFEISCKLKDRVGCLTVAGFARRKGDYDVAKDYSSKSCDLGEGNGCFYLARLEKKLGNKQKEIEYLGKGCLFNHSGSCYNLACEYSLKKNPEMALKYLDLAILNGFNSFEKIEHMKSDSDLNNIKYSDEFESILKKYFD
jgi:tetratricopeptide (TPR) repeat protein